MQSRRVHINVIVFKTDNKISRRYGWTKRNTREFVRAKKFGIFENLYSLRR